MAIEKKTALTQNYCQLSSFRSSILNLQQKILKIIKRIFVEVQFFAAYLLLLHTQSSRHFFALFKSDFSLLFVRKCRHWSTLRTIRFSGYALAKFVYSWSPQQRTENNVSLWMGKAGKKSTVVKRMNLKSKHLHYVQRIVKKIWIEWVWCYKKTGGTFSFF